MVSQWVIAPSVITHSSASSHNFVHVAPSLALEVCLFVFVAFCLSDVLPFLLCS